MPLISLEVSFLAITDADSAGPAAPIFPEARPRAPSLAIPAIPTTAAERGSFLEVADFATPARRAVLASLFRRALRIAEPAEREAQEGPKKLSPVSASPAEAPGLRLRSRSAIFQAGDCRPGFVCLDPEDLEIPTLRARLEAPIVPTSLEALLESETEAFMRYLEGGDIPALRLALGLRAETLRREAATKVLRSLSHLSAEDRAIVEELSHKVIDEFLGGALQRLGEGETKAGAHTALLRDIFDLPREDRA